MRQQNIFCSSVAAGILSTYICRSWTRYSTWRSLYACQECLLSPHHQDKHKQIVPGDADDIDDEEIAWPLRVGKAGGGLHMGRMELWLVPDRPGGGGVHLAP